MTHQVTKAVTKARAIIARQETITSVDALALVNHLKYERKFNYARRVLGVVRRTIDAADAKWLKLGQQHALCTYKDTDIPARHRLERAVEILRKVDDPDSGTAGEETLGLAGAIWKRYWEMSARTEDLERALAYYEAGAVAGFADESCYAAINAAFVLDVLATEDERQPKVTNAGRETAARRRGAAQDYRTRIVDVLSRQREAASNDFAKEWWGPATLAEAHFGLGEYDAANDLLTKARAESRTEESPYGPVKKPAEWELESTARQLASLARLRAPDASLDDLEGSRPWQVVASLVGADVAVVRSAFIGKVGLALSGGGFRASLFHIGVLARLAELDLLRHVEVISCVSGGSIVGAHYYLKLKRLLETIPDHATRAGGQRVEREDYVRIVRDLEKDFLVGVQRNVRTRLFAEFTTNLRMLFQPGFTRTRRAGELYEREIYSRMKGDGTRDTSRPKPRYMTELFVAPAGEGEGFHPAYHNWRRRSKVPVLVLNATTLNTGHRWQFTASWMGEPPGDIDADVDGNYRLRRLYYDQAPAEYTKRPVRLGHAVAASAAVPGIFDPLDLSLLYAHPPVPPGKRGRRITVRLVDGGVHDNQGTASLTDQDCTVQLVSDASGQMDTLDEPGGSPFGVLLRSSSVQGARVRTAQYDDLSARRRAGALSGLLFVHLKRGLGVRQIDWRGCDEPYAIYGDQPNDASALNPDDPQTFYGVSKKAQRRLAIMRTDLDSFTDAEAYALMQSGYSMTVKEAQACGLERVANADPKPVDWAFRAMEQPLAEAPATSPAALRLDRLLAASCHRALKIWRLNRWLTALGVLLGVAALAAAAWFIWQNRSAPIPLPKPTWGTLGKSLVVLLIGIVGGALVKRLLSIVNYRNTLGQIVLSTILALGGFLVARLHLWVFDRLFRRWGAVKRFSPARKEVART